MGGESTPIRGRHRWAVEQKANLPHFQAVSFRTGFYAGLFIAAIWAIWLIRLWQPDRQVALHSIHLLQQIERKNWTTVADRVSPEYQDRWGHDRAILLER